MIKKIEKEGEIMKAEHVNPFIKSFIDILKSVAGIEVSMGKPFLKESPILLKDVAIIIGITSDLKGQIVISMDKDTALSVASHMMMGLPLNELDEMSKSALCEIGNMILGHSASGLYEIGVIVDITPPSIIFGKGMELSSNIKRNITIPFESSVGEFYMEISLIYN